MIRINPNITKAKYKYCSIAPKIISNIASYHGSTSQKNTHRTSTSTTADTTNEHADFLKHTATHCKSSQYPHAIFPWRHSSDPLLRLNPNLNSNKNTIESRLYNPMGPQFPPFPSFPRFLMRISTENYMSIPFWQSLVSRIPFSPYRWDDELATQFSWAFGKAVSGMIMNTYHVDNVEQEHKDGSSYIDFQHITSHHGTDSTDKSNDSGDNLHHDENAMIHSQLQQLYQSALFQSTKSSSTTESTSASTSGSTSTYQIKLQTQPLHAQIESLFFIPILTRKHVETEHPRFKGRFLQLLEEVAYKRIVEQESFSQVMQEFYESVLSLEDRVSYPLVNDETRMDCYHVTIIAQVSIRCQELFQVKHVDTGDIVQGSQDGKQKEVVHLVRFEMVNILNENGALVQTGSWQITDWDDLMDGNIWF